jgi:hypothetical protein
MRRFDTPAAPPGWAGQGAGLLRIVDPTGRAIAWLAPAYGGTCVGLAVRRGGDTSGGWRHILRSGGPRDLRADPLGYGCAVLGPGAGNRHAAHLAPWRLVERDPTAATCTARCGPDGSGDPFAVRLDLIARLDDAALHLDLLATNEGAEDVPLSPGLRLNLAEEFRRDEQPGSGEPSAAFTGADGAVCVVVASLGTLGKVDHARGSTYTVRIPDAPLAPGARISVGMLMTVDL